MYSKKIVSLAIICLFFLFTFAWANPEINIQTWKTAQGTPVYYVNEPQIPMVDVLVAFHAGADRDATKPGLANFTANMIGQGTTHLSADEIADQFDNLGIVFNSSCTRDMSVIGFRSLTKSTVLTSALQLFSDTLSQANFPTTAFARMKANSLQAIAMQQQDPKTIAMLNFYKNTFANSVYENPTLGTKSSVNALTETDIANFYKQYYVSHNAVIVIVGAVDAALAKTMAEHISSALPTGQPAAELTTAPINVGKSIQINFPTDQTTIVTGSVGIAYNNPDEFPLLVGNYILGGNMSSRLFSIVREKYGLSYGVGSYFIPYAHKGPFVIALQTKNDQVKTALTITDKVLTDYLVSGPTANELKSAKDFLIGNFPLKIADNSSIANYVLTIAFYHLPLNYLNTYREKVNAVTLEQIKTAMNQYVKPANFVTVTVGGQSAN